VATTDWAVQAGFPAAPDIVLALLNAGADETLTDRWGETAEDHAMRREKENPATIAALRRQPYEHLPRTSQEVREREAAAAAEEAAAAAAAAAAAQVEPQAAHTQRRRKAKADEGAEGKVSRQQRDADAKAEREKAAAERKKAAARDRAAKEE